MAGVSIGTASKALNGQGKLRPETRDRVAAAARELGFAPNVLARGLLAGRTYTVGVITTDSFGRFSIPVMLGAEDALGVGQISVFMCDTRDEPERILGAQHHRDAEPAEAVGGDDADGVRAPRQQPSGQHVGREAQLACGRGDPVPGLGTEFALAVQCLGSGSDRDARHGGDVTDGDPPRASVLR